MTTYSSIAVVEMEFEAVFRMGSSPDDTVEDELIILCIESDRRCYGWIYVLARVYECLIDGEVSVCEAALAVQCIVCWRLGIREAPVHPRGISSFHPVLPMIFMPKLIELFLDRHMDLWNTYPYWIKNLLLTNSNIQCFQSLLSTNDTHGLSNTIIRRRLNELDDSDGRKLSSKLRNDQRCSDNQGKPGSRSH